MRRTRKAGATDRTVEATGLPDGCKRALLTPGSVYSALRELESALGDAAPRVASGTAEGALIELAGMAKIANQLPDRDKLLAATRCSVRS